MQKRILLVEDEQLLLQFVQRQLQKEKFEVSIAGDGKSALDLINKEPFTLIISDLMIPYISGFELISQIRKSEHNKTTPTLIISAMGSDEVIVDALHIGADDFLRKPYSMDVMIAKVNRMVDGLGSYNS